MNLYFSDSEVIAIENERIVPQQAASTVTNIDDIESYIHYLKAQTCKVYLKGFDLQMLERN